VCIRKSETVEFVWTTLHRVCTVRRSPRQQQGKKRAKHQVKVVVVVVEVVVDVVDVVVFFLFCFLLVARSRVGNDDRRLLCLVGALAGRRRRRRRGARRRVDDDDLPRLLLARRRGRRCHGRTACGRGTKDNRCFTVIGLLVGCRQQPTNASDLKPSKGAPTRVSLRQLERILYTKIWKTKRFLNPVRPKENEITKKNTNRWSAGWPAGCCRAPASPGSRGGPTAALSTGPLRSVRPALRCAAPSSLDR